MHDIRNKFTQWHKDEFALRHTRVRHDKFGGVNHVASPEEKIEIAGARRVRSLPGAPELLFDGKERAQKVARAAPPLYFQNGVVIIAAVRSAPRFAFVNGRSPQRGKTGVAENPDRARQVRCTQAKVRSEADVRVLRNSTGGD